MSGVEDPIVHVLWMNAGLSCDGDSVSLTSATLPSVEEIALGALPGMPKVQFHWPLIDYEVGADFLRWFFEGEAGRLAILVFRAATLVSATRRLLADGAIDAAGDGEPGRLSHDYLVGL